MKFKYIIYFIGDTELDLYVPLLFCDACIRLIHGYIFIFGSSSISLSSSDPFSGRTPTLAAATWWSRGWWVSCGLGRTEWGGSALGWYELRPFRSSWWLKSAIRRGSVETSGTVLFNTFEMIRKLTWHSHPETPKFYPKIHPELFSYVFHHFLWNLGQYLDGQTGYSDGMATMMEWVCTGLGNSNSLHYLPKGSNKNFILNSHILKFLISSETLMLTKLILNAYFAFYC